MQPGFPKLMTAIHDVQSALVSSHKKGRPSRSRTAFILVAYLKSASVSNLLPCISFTLCVPARIMLIVISFLNCTMTELTRLRTATSPSACPFSPCPRWAAGAWACWLPRSASWARAASARRPENLFRALVQRPPHAAFLLPVMPDFLGLRGSFFCSSLHSMMS